MKNTNSKKIIAGTVAVGILSSLAFQSVSAFGSTITTDSTQSVNEETTTDNNYNSKLETSTNSDMAEFENLFQDFLEKKSEINPDLNSLEELKSYDIQSMFRTLDSLKERINVIIDN